MTRTTPPPRRDVLALLPEWAELAVTTIRLHPRRGKVDDPAASKLGGLFLWPQEEPWPTCDEAGHHDARGPSCTVGSTALVPVLQLRATDFPEMPFRPGKGPFPLLWCPLAHDYPAR